MSAASLHSNQQTDRKQHPSKYVMAMVEYLQEDWDNDDFEEIEEIKEKLQQNVVLGIEFIKDTVRELHQLGIQPKSVYIRAQSIRSQNILISLSTEDQLKSKFSEIYCLTGKMEQKSKSDSYALQFTFTFDNGHLSEEVLACAGYLPVSIK